MKNMANSKRCVISGNHQALLFDYDKVLWETGNHIDSFMKNQLNMFETTNQCFQDPEEIARILVDQLLTNESMTLPLSKLTDLFWSENYALLHKVLNG